MFLCQEECCVRRPYSFILTVSIFFEGDRSTFPNRQEEVFASGARKIRVYGFLVLRNDIE